MRTTIDINSNLLQQALRLTKARTKRAVVDLALSALIRKERMERLKARAGSVRMTLTPRRLAELRRLG